MRHLHISHNAPYLPPPKFCITFVFSFLPGITAIPREIESNAYAKFKGANKVHYGRCVSGVCSGIHAVDFGFQVLDTGFIQSVKPGFWILKTRIPHSTSKNFLLFRFPLKNYADSGIQISSHGRLNIPHFSIFNKKKLFPFFWLPLLYRYSVTT